MIQTMPSPHLSREDEHHLARRWRDFGDKQSLDKLIEANINIVHGVVRGEFSGSDIPYDDLLQEGCIGLTLAARRFDPDRGFKLSTYATWWIRAAIMHYLLNMKCIVRPGGRGRRVYFRLSRAKRMLNGEATPENLAKALDISEEDVNTLLACLSRVESVANDVSHDEVRDVTIVADESPSVEDLLGDQESSHRIKTIVREKLKCLERLEKTVIEARYFREPQQPFRALGHRFGLSGERVRQIEEKAKRKLKRLLLQEVRK